MSEENLLVPILQRVNVRYLQLPLFYRVKQLYMCIYMRNRIRNTSMPHFYFSFTKDKKAFAKLLNGLQEKRETLGGKVKNDLSYLSCQSQSFSITLSSLVCVVMVSIRHLILLHIQREKKTYRVY